MASAPSPRLALVVSVLLLAPALAEAGEWNWTVAPEVPNFQLAPPTVPASARDPDGAWAAAAADFGLRLGEALVPAGLYAAFVGAASTCSGSGASCETFYAAAPALLVLGGAVFLALPALEGALLSTIGDGRFRRSSHWLIGGAYMTLGGSAALGAVVGFATSGGLGVLVFALAFLLAGPAILGAIHFETSRGLEAGPAGDRGEAARPAAGAAFAF